MGKIKINVIIEQHGLPGNVGTNGKKKKKRYILSNKLLKTMGSKTC